MNKNRDIVIFTGAGFSCDAGLPTMAGFGNESRKELAAWRKLAKSRESGEMYLKAGNIFEEFCLYCSSAGKYLNIDINNMETIFCIAEAMKESGVDDILLNGNKMKIDSILKQIKLWLWKIYHQCRIVNKNKHEAPPYQDLIDILQSNELMSRMSIVTTNYDLVFEHIACEQGAPCVYPIADSDYQPLPVTENIESYLAEDNDVDAPLVCKLHGSINYFTVGDNNPVFVLISKNCSFVVLVL